MSSPTEPRTARPAATGPPARPGKSAGCRDRATSVAPDAPFAGEPAGAGAVLRGDPHRQVAGSAWWTAPRGRVGPLGRRISVAGGQDGRVPEGDTVWLASKRMHEALA